jgi:tRNA 2-thiocytidine biosynthesis protein TtcA
MCPKQELFQGKLTVIRPLAYVEEREISAFAKEKKFPAFCAICPQTKNSQREKIAEIIRGLKRVCPDVTTNIFRSVKRIRPEYLL